MSKYGETVAKDRADWLLDAIAGAVSPHCYNGPSARLAAEAAIEASGAAELHGAAAELLGQIDKLMPLFEKAIADAWDEGDYVNGPQFGGAVERFRTALASCDTHPEGRDAKQGSVHG